LEQNYKTIKSEYDQILNDQNNKEHITETEVKDKEDKQLDELDKQDKQY